MDRSLFLIRTIAGAMIAFIALSITMELPWFKPTPVGDLRYRSPIIALELPQSVDDVKQVLGDSEMNRTKVRRSLAMDAVFIATYTLQFVLLARLLMQRPQAWAVPLGSIVMLTIVGAAVADVMENYYLWKILDVTLDESAEPLVGSIRNVSLVKWMLVFAATALLAPLYCCWNGAFRALGYLLFATYVLSAGIGLFGLWFSEIFEWSFRILAFGILGTIITFSGWAGVVVKCMKG